MCIQHEFHLSREHLVEIFSNIICQILIYNVFVLANHFFFNI